MNDPGAGWQGQPPDQPFAYQDPMGGGGQPGGWPGGPMGGGGQPGGWPGGYQQPGPGGPGQPFQQMQPAGSFQPQPSNEALMSGEQILVIIGDITVTSSTVYTPSGSRPLSEVTWTFTDMSVTSQGIPTWAIVCAIVFFVFCFLGLLFLLAKEDKTQGAVQVTVHGPGFLHTSTIPVASLAQVADVNARVNYVRTLTASYPSAPQPGIAGQMPGDQQGIAGQWPQDPSGQAGQPWLQNPPSDPGQQGQQGQQPGQSW